MITPFEKDFEDLLEEILTDWRNQDPAVDLAQASPNFIKAACLASALWGLHKGQGYIADQIFADSADEANLERHCYTRGLSRKTGESPADLLTRLLGYIRRPPAGGNKYDYVKWGLDIQGVKAAYSVPLGQGPGTVDVVVVADAALTGSEIPDPALLDQVKAHIDDVRPVTAKYTRVLPISLSPTDVTVTGTGINYNKVQTANDIAAYLSAMLPGQTLFPAALWGLAISNGAEDITGTVPDAPLVPASNEAIRPGVISVP